jgi:arylsulfatase A-like enzyme
LYSYDVAPSKYRATGKLPQDSGFEEYFLWHDRLTEDKGSRYADPVINDNGKMLENTKGLYGPDSFSDYVIRFMEKNRDQPFFVYFPMVLTHGPFNATPRSADWKDGDRLKDDPKHFKDMVEYMDSDAGKVFDAIDRLGLAGNTLVLFYADNGTPPEITSNLGSRVVPGGKRLTTEAGMHVPLMARWRGVSPIRRLCDDLIDSTDFLPTLCEATGAKWSGPLDGRSFLPQILGKRGEPKDALFAHFDPHPSCKADIPPTRLAWDHRWKLYLDGRLFDWKSDPLETKPVSADSGEAAQARARLQAVLDQMARVQPPKFNKFDPDGKAPY